MMITIQRPKMAQQTFLLLFVRELPLREKNWDKREREKNIRKRLTWNRLPADDPGHIWHSFFGCNCWSASRDAMTAPHLERSFRPRPRRWMTTFRYWKSCTRDGQQKKPEKSSSRCFWIIKSYGLI